MNSIEEVIILQLFTDLEKNPLSLCDVQIFTGNAVKTKVGELAKSGEAVQFLNSKNEVQNTFYIVLLRKIKPSINVISDSLKNYICIPYHISFLFSYCCKLFL